MEPLNDRELDKLLRQWEAPAAPASLRSPLQVERPRVWRRLWQGRIQIPLPVAVLGVVALIVIWLRPLPVSAPVIPVAPVPDGAIGQTAQTAPVLKWTAPTTPPESASASLAGFRAVTQLEAKIIQVRP